MFINKTQLLGSLILGVIVGIGYYSYESFINQRQVTASGKWQKLMMRHPSGKPVFSKPTSQFYLTIDADTSEVPQVGEAITLTGTLISKAPIKSAKVKWFLWKGFEVVKGQESQTLHSFIPGEPQYVAITLRRTPNDFIGVAHLDVTAEEESGEITEAQTSFSTENLGEGKIKRELLVEQFNKMKSNKALQKMVQ